MAKRKRKSADRDAASSRQERDELADRDEQLRAMALELALALRVAMRWLVDLSPLVPVGKVERFKHDFQIVERVHDGLDEVLCG
jgi:hypothetical protein